MYSRAVVVEYWELWNSEKTSKDTKYTFIVTQILIK